MPEIHICMCERMLHVSCSILLGYINFSHQVVGFHSHVEKENVYATIFQNLVTHWD